MHDRFFLLWLTCTLILVPAAWAAILVVFVRCFRFDLLSRPMVEKLSSSTYFETHIIEAIERFRISPCAGGVQLVG
jgi:hypothetical protein